jgi:exonuclease SbcD
MSVVRLLQVADFHLGRPFGWLPVERRAERRAEQRRALEQAVRHAIERDCHALLVPGDLFDAEYVDADTLAFATEAFAVTGCPPVFVAPGNHDPASESSPYWNPARLKARGRAWPAHVHVFADPHWRGVPLEGHGVHVWGRCFSAGVEATERPLDPTLLSRAGVPRDGLHVAVFHGSREGVCPPGQSLAAPFSDAEAFGSPFHYLAAGHYHTPSQLERDGSVRLAYAGAPVALDLTELGAHGALEVTIETGIAAPVVRTAPVELDRRRVHDLAVDVTGCATAEQIDRRLWRALDQAGVGEDDLATLRISGRIGRGVRYAAPGAELRGRAWHLRLRLEGLRPDHDLEALRAGTSDTTEERFARRLLERIDATADPAERGRLERALAYGLDAFRLGEVVPAYEEIES